MRSYFVIILSIISFQVFSQTDRKFIRSGNGVYKEGKFQEAEIEYRKALEKDSGSFKANYNLGNALYKQHQYDAALQKYAGLIQTREGSDELNRYYYNLGNAFFEKGEYNESIDAYKNALRNDPHDLDAKHNLQLALRKLSEQKQNQNKDNQQQNTEQKNQQENNAGKNKNDDNQKQDEANQPNNQENQEKGKPDQPQNVKGEISRENAERILQALENEEKDVIKKVQEQKERMKKDPLEKDW
jgi:Ca-activated chloride channel homolog